MNTLPDIYTADLLNVIAEGESKGNYNAHYGNARNSSIAFTSMSVREVIQWQQEFVENGSPSSAVGRYQIIDTTLKELVDQLHIEENTLFDRQLQDRLAVALLERRGLRAFVDNKITQDEFAHNLSKEWAALPQTLGDTPQASYYANDGLNAAQLSVEQIRAGIQTVYVL